MSSTVGRGDRMPDKERKILKKTTQRVKGGNKVERQTDNDRQTRGEILQSLKTNV